MTELEQKIYEIYLAENPPYCDHPYVINKADGTARAFAHEIAGLIDENEVTKRKIEEYRKAKRAEYGFVGEMELVLDSINNWLDKEEE